MAIMQNGIKCPPNRFVCQAEINGLVHRCSVNILDSDWKMLLMRELEEGLCQANTFRVEIGSATSQRVLLPIDAGSEEEKAAGSRTAQHQHLDTTESKAVPQRSAKSR